MGEIAGWFAPENRERLQMLIDLHQVKTVVEIGSFLGRSAVWFAERVEHVYCVDTWYEGATFESENNLLRTLRTWELPRDFFSIFRDNVMRSGVWNKITPIRGHSRWVAPQVPVCDLVYIDGDHSYAGCRHDIETYQDKARLVICGDDYAQRVDFVGTPAFGVIEAVTEAFPDHQHAGPFWWAAPVLQF